MSLFTTQTNVTLKLLTSVEFVMQVVPQCRGSDAWTFLHHWLSPLFLLSFVFWSGRVGRVLRKILQQNLPFFFPETDQQEKVYLRHRHFRHWKCPLGCFVLGMCLELFFCFLRVFSLSKKL